MARTLVGFFAFLGVMTAITAAIALAMIVGRSSPDVPDSVILELDLTGGLVEYVPADPVAQLALRDRTSVRDVVLALERAADDERVVALIARVGTGFGLPAKVQEIRNAVAHFRSRGKLAIAYAETFGAEMGAASSSGTTNYYLATAFDEIHLLPIGSVGLSGLALEAVFVRGVLDKLGIEPRFDSRKEYKSAKNSLTDKAFTEPHRESFARIVESQYERIAADIARDRKLSAEVLDRLARRGALDSQAALEAGLIDRVSYPDEVYARVQERSGERAELLYLKSYLARSSGRGEASPTIALIYGVGNVVQGESGYQPLTGTTWMGSDSVTAAFRQAIDDDAVQAIVFRIDSGGGSAVASQLMWRETIRAREKGKPVIATMSDIAGSGGYFIAMGADRIVAQPGTITGSIGVVAGKLLTQKLWDELGISFDEVRTHPNVSMWKGTRDFTPEQWEIFQSSLDDVYAQFKKGVAEGRDLSMEEVERIARGRIWTGSDAKELGLVDELGGLPAALRLAKQAAGIPAEVEVELTLYPPSKTPFALLLERLRREEPHSSESPSAVLAARTLEAIHPLARVADALGLGAPRGVLEMPIRVRP